MVRGTKVLAVHTVLLLLQVISSCQHQQLRP
jgi:hypothetical protein